MRKSTIYHRCRWGRADRSKRGRQKNSHGHKQRTNTTTVMSPLFTCTSLYKKLVQQEFLNPGGDAVVRQRGPRKEIVAANSVGDKTVAKVKM